MPESSKTNKPRVLILNYEFPPLGGGAANATYYLLKELGLRPDDVSATLITSSVHSDRHETFASNIDIHFLDIGKNGNIHYQSQKDLLTYSWKAYSLARRLHKTQPFDVVHAFFGIPCGFIAMRLGIPYIVSLRGSDVPFYNERFYWQDKLVFKRLSGLIWRKAKHVVANSKGLQELALRSFPKQEVGIIPNGIDLSEFPETAVISGQKDLHVISTGRLIPRKGYSLLLEALKDLQAVRVSLIGDGPEKMTLKAQADELSIDLTLHGAVEHNQIPSLLTTADLFILPSYNEGMSNAALEAMAAGLPLLLTDVGGSAELITDNGWIIPKGESKPIREIMQHCQANPEALANMGVASRAKAESMSWSQMAAQYLALYSS